MDTESDHESSAIPATVGVGHVFEGLADRRRRYLLYALNDGVERSLEELAAEILAWERSVPEDDLGDDEIERVRVALYHSHVPKLIELDIVRCEGGTVTLGPTAETALTVLENAGWSAERSLEGRARDEQSGEWA